MQWPDNEPAVSCLDWQTGEVNAKYYAIQMLAQLGAGPKSFLQVDVEQPPPPPPPPAPAHEIKTLADCAAKARSTCKMANYVSFSVKNQDCSWYTKCNLTTGIGNPTRDYESEAIRPTIGPAHAVCCGDTDTGADCNKPGKGSWPAAGGHPPPPPGPAIFALPYIVHEQDDAKGMLLIAKTEAGAEVTLASAPNGTTALVLEGVGAEPGFNPPTEKAVGPGGRLSLGPCACPTFDMPIGRRWLDV